MEITCNICKRTVTVDPRDTHGRVIVNKVASVLQCVCGKHVTAK